MNPSPEDPSDAAPPRSDRLSRLEETLKADVDEARAIEPLVASAGDVTGRVRSWVGRALPLVALVALGGVLLVSGLYEELKLDTLARHHTQLKEFVGQYPVLSALALIGSLAMLVSTGLPGGSIIVFSAGVLFGIVEGTLLALVGNTIGATVLYFAARRLFGGPGSKAPAMVERIRSGFERHPTSFAFFIRMVPVFPYGAASIALAWLGCRFPLFVVSSFFGVIPPTAILASLGAGLSHSLDEHQTLSLSVLSEPRFAIPLVALAVLALVPLLLGLRKKKGPE
jgi:uncharacterized membrane protein YdjX (TVP38/TMEM64 family)